MCVWGGDTKLQREPGVGCGLYSTLGSLPELVSLRDLVAVVRGAQVGVWRRRLLLFRSQRSN